MSTQTATPILRMASVAKRFGGEYALRGVDFEVRPGEIHGLLGANGSGKSTLIKTLAGYHAPEHGAVVEVNGETLELPVREAVLRRLCVAFVHQDLALFPKMTVLENLRVAELTLRHRPFISWRSERQAARRVLSLYGLGNVDPLQTVDTLSRTDRAQLAIARAFVAVGGGEPGRDHPGSGGGLVVLDEPTAFLPAGAAEDLFRLMRQFAASGNAIVFVSHELEEILEVTDRVTVLRDGSVAGAEATRNLSVDDLVRLIVGDITMHARTPAAPATAAEPYASLEVKGLTGARVDGVSFAVRPGEVLGLAGLVGSGFDDVPYLIFGARPAAAGTIRIGSDVYDAAAMSPDKAVAAGVAFVPADRQTLGVFAELSIDDNLSPTVLAQYQSRGYLSRRRMRADARRLVAEAGVVPPRTGVVLSSLSGGNQQKVLMSKWMRRTPRVMVLHEPTQGVDVGARQEIYRRLLAVRGDCCVICATTDHEELELLCDRVLVLSRGRITAELTGAEVTKSRITEACVTLPPPGAGQSTDESDAIGDRRRPVGDLAGSA